MKWWHYALIVAGIALVWPRKASAATSPTNVGPTPSITIPASPGKGDAGLGGSSGERAPDPAADSAATRDSELSPEDDEKARQLLLGRS